MRLFGAMANLAHRGRFAGSLLPHRGPCKQQCRAIPRKPARGFRRFALCALSVEICAVGCSHRTGLLPLWLPQWDCLPGYVVRHDIGLQPPELSSAVGSRSKNLLQRFADFFVLHEVSALRRRQTQVDSLDKSLIVREILAQNLLSEFVGLQSPLGGNLRQLRFLLGL